MEPRFGRDFSNVRLHAGDEARKGASAVSARAYTIGNDIVLGSGAHASHASKDQHLLAHELTHVAQQHGGARPASGMSVPGDAFERQADAVADAVVGERSVLAMLSGLRPAGTQLQPSVMRKEGPESKPNPAEFQFVPIEKGGTWDALVILEQISQREYTPTPIASPQIEHGKESDPYRCGPSAVLASAIVGGPKAVMDLCVNLYKRILESREKAAKEAEAFKEKVKDAKRDNTNPGPAQTEVPTYAVCDSAARAVFDIHWNLETGIKFGSHEGGGYTLTFADLDRLSSYLYMFTFNATNKWRQDATAAGTASFRTEDEIADAAVMAGYDTDKASISTHEVKEEWALDFRLNLLKPGQTMIGMWGPHTYTFFRKGDTIYLYDSWRKAVDEEAAEPTFLPADGVHERGSPEYKKRVDLGLGGKYTPIKLMLNTTNKLKL